MPPKSCPRCQALVEDGRGHTADCGLPEDCRAYLERRIAAIRAVARACGYAVAVHGSMARDVDLVAVAWTDDAVDATSLMEAVRAAGRGMKLGTHGPAMKPHGRVAWCIQVGNGIVVDLSIVPPRPVPIPSDDSGPEQRDRRSERRPSSVCDVFG